MSDVEWSGVGWARVVVGGEGEERRARLQALQALCLNSSGLCLVSLQLVVRLVAEVEVAASLFAVCFPWQRQDSVAFGCLPHPKWYNFSEDDTMTTTTGSERGTVCRSDDIVPGETREVTTDLQNEHIGVKCTRALSFDSYCAIKDHFASPAPHRTHTSHTRHPHRRTAKQPYCGDAPGREDGRLQQDELQCGGSRAASLGCRL